MRRPAPSLTPEAEAALLQYHWPGNVRELENVIERALAFDQEEEIRTESLIFGARWKTQPAADMACPDAQEGGESLIPAGVKFDDLALHDKRRLVKQALQRCCGNRKKTAAMLGLSSRHRLYRLMIKLGINPGAGY
jgi:two-component system response regulator PilR (NtrC family)